MSTPQATEHVEFAVDAETLARYSDWTECAAFRFVRDGDEVTFEFAFSLDEITAPEASDAA